MEVRQCAAAADTEVMTPALTSHNPGLVPTARGNKEERATRNQETWSRLLVLLLIKHFTLERNHLDSSNSILFLLNKGEMIVPTSLVAIKTKGVMYKSFENSKGLLGMFPLKFILNTPWIEPFNVLIIVYQSRIWVTSNWN